MRAGLQIVDLDRAARRRPRARPASGVASSLMVDAEQPDEVGAAALAEFQEVGVIDEAGEIGVLEIDADRQDVGLALDPPGEVGPIARSRLFAAVEQRELGRGLRRRRQAEMDEGCCGQHAAARRARDEALLEQIGLDDLLDRIARLGQRRGDGLDADRAAAVIHRRCSEIAMVERVEARARRLRAAAARGRRPWRRSRRRPRRRRNRARAVAAARRCAACRARAARSRRRPPR